MKPVIVAELSANAASDLQTSMGMVEAAARAGADAIKLQTWTPGTMCLDPAYTIKAGPWKGKPLAQLYQDAHTPWEWHKPLFERARELGMLAWSTPFDLRAVDFLSLLDVPCWKIASFEILDKRLIQYCASTRKPMILSTGMADRSEIQDAVDWIRDINPTAEITLLQCTSAYPAMVTSANLHTMVHMQRVFNCRVGISDHTMGPGPAVAAVVLGATMVEKHFTSSRTIPSPDRDFSLEPQEFRLMATACREAYDALGSVRYGLKEGENRELRRGLYWARDLHAGHVLTYDDMVTARPATFTRPAYAQSLIGTKLATAVQRGSQV